MTNLKKKISDGDTILGTWNTMGSTISTKVIASSGLDFQILDLAFQFSVMGGATNVDAKRGIFESILKVAWEHDPFSKPRPQIYLLLT